MTDPGRVIPVEIQGQRYPIRTALEPEYVARLARYVEDKILAASDITPSGDSLRLARTRAYQAVEKIRFAGAQYRRDIAHRALKK